MEEITIPELATALDSIDEAERVMQRARDLRDRAILDALGVGYTRRQVEAASGGRVSLSLVNQVVRADRSQRRRAEESD